MIEKPRLDLDPWKIGEPFIYKGSQCGQQFLLPEDHGPEVAMAEVWAAFDEHVREVHAAVDEGG